MSEKHMHKMKSTQALYFLFSCSYNKKHVPLQPAFIPKSVCVMNKLISLLALLALLACGSCSSNKSDKPIEPNNENNEQEIAEYHGNCNNYDNFSVTSEFEDGTYSATVDYYNPNTGTSNTYSLDVEVEDNHVVTIYFNNGGYLDENHIEPGELDEDGYCIVHGEEGKTYEISLDL